jgi:hypothetical protein
MSRWQLRAIYLFSHDGRRRDMTFDLNAVNVITGPAGSGKSAICEVIDYCFGADECHIPDLVREATSWPSILLSNGTTEVLLARRMPPPNQLSSDEIFLSFGSALEIPTSADALHRTTNTGTLLRQLEQLIGIGNVRTEVFGTSRKSNRISARSVVPFLLQSDDVIINKTVLFRGGQDERRNSIIDSFPYFLDVTDEATIGKEQELRRLIAQRTAEERRIALADRQRDILALSLRTIATEAQGVGLIDISAQDATVHGLRAALQSVASWSPEQDGGGGGGTNRLTELTNHERQLHNERSRLLNEINESREAFQEASQFVTTTERQQRRLQVVDLFSSGDAAIETCPVCSNKIMQHTETLAHVRAAYRQLQLQLRSAERERPQIDDYISTLQTRIDDLSSKLEIVTAQLRTVVRESGSIQENLDLNQRRMRIVGRVSYYLEIADEVEVPPSTAHLDALNLRIAGLQDELDASNKLDRLQDAQRQVGMSADSILEDLPFASPYPERSVYLNTRDLTTGVLTEQRRISMRDIGSDENYLSLHMSIALGLQRYFKLHNRPVPGFIVFDQLSRPFYPPDKRPEIVSTHTDADRGALKQYFDVLFKEVAAQKDLQIIVLEHAFFADDDRFVKAVGSRYLDPEKLIPEGWPQVK